VKTNAFTTVGPQVVESRDRPWRGTWELRNPMLLTTRVTRIGIIELRKPN